jgi:transcriptional regulator GlxA family with amidase domain
MRDNLAEDIAMETLVALTGLGRARFFQAFKTTMGRTPFAHLLYLRLIHARTLLVRTRLSTTEVASDVGLSSTQFAVAFRRTHGMTPSAYHSMHGSTKT